MSVIDNLITDRTSSDVSRWSELKSKGWSGMTEAEKAEWSAGMKGAYKYTDLNRVNEAMVYLQNRLRGYGYLVDVVLPVIEEVEPGTSRLPTGYQEVEYIQSSGTQYVDTGLSLTSGFQLDISFSYEDENTKKSLGVFGAHDNISPYGRSFLSVHRTSDEFVIGINDAEASFGAASAGPWYHILCKNSSDEYFAYIDGVQQPLSPNSSTSGQYSSSSLYLFNVHGGEEWFIPIKAKISFCKVYDVDGIKVRDFVPCKNPSSIVGLYDLVNDAFYTNAGTGTFTAGPDVGTQPTITTRPYWAEGDIPKQAQMEQYLQNVSNIRAVLEVLQTTPPVPSDMVGLTFEEANDIERILVDVETVINRVVAGFFRSNAFTVICGNRPLPSAQSDLGRTWDDIDAEDLTWDDLDEHGSGWYVIQYGVLKGTVVGIL